MQTEPISKITNEEKDQALHTFESLINLLEENIHIFKPNYLNIQFTGFKTYLNNAMVKTMSSRRDTNPPAIYDEM